MPEHRESITVVLPTTAHQYAVKEALKYWHRAAEAKVNKVRAMQAEAEEKGRELSTSEKADVEAVNTRVFTRMANTMDILQEIEGGGVDGVG